MTGIVGRTYLERGEPVVVLAQWRQVPKAGLLVLPGLDLKVTRPRNVLIQRADGTEVVRPLRGLRKVSPEGVGSAALAGCADPCAKGSHRD